jgi:hypothetical protein
LPGQAPDAGVQQVPPADVSHLPPLPGPTAERVLVDPDVGTPGIAIDRLPVDIPVDFAAMVKSHLKPAPYSLQLSAKRLADIQVASCRKKLESMPVDGVRAVLEQQDAAYMMRLAQLASEHLRAGRGLLVVDGLDPDPTIGKRHFFQALSVAERAGRTVSIFVDLSEFDEELLAYDSAVRELRRDLAARAIARFNERHDGDRRAALSRFRSHFDLGNVANWSMLGLSDEEGVFVQVDEATARLQLRQ